MELNFISDALETVTCSVLAAYSFEGNPDSSGTVERLPSATRSLLGELRSSGELTGKAYECTLIHRPAGLAAPLVARRRPARRLSVLGVGTEEGAPVPLRGGGFRGGGGQLGLTLQDRVHLVHRDLAVVDARRDLRFVGWPALAAARRHQRQHADVAAQIVDGISQIDEAAF